MILLCLVDDCIRRTTKNVTTIAILLRLNMPVASDIATCACTGVDRGSWAAPSDFQYAWLNERHSKLFPRHVAWRNRESATWPYVSLLVSLPPGSNLYKMKSELFVPVEFCERSNNLQLLLTQLLAVQDRVSSFWKGRTELYIRPIRIDPADAYLVITSIRY